MRLTKAKREQIVAAAIERSQQAQALKELQTSIQFKLAETCRVLYLGGEEVAQEIEKAEVAIAKATENVPTSVLLQTFNRRGGISVNYATGGSRQTRFLKFKQLEICDSYSFTLDSYPAVTEAVNDYFETEKRLNDEISKLKSEVLGIVNSVSTVKRLLEVWPECEALIPEPAVTNQTPPPPAKTVAALNSALKLP